MKSLITNICIICVAISTTGCLTLVDGYLPFTEFSPVDGGKSLINTLITKFIKDKDGKKRDPEQIKVIVKSEEIVSPMHSSDVIDLSKVVWLHTDVSKWKISHDLSISFSNGRIIYNTRAPWDWPKKFMGPVAKGGYLVGNPWVFIEKDGKFYGATYEWLRADENSKPMKTVMGDHIGKDPFKQWAPTLGKKYPFMLSGLARDGSRNVKLRTTAVWATWPE